MSCFRSSNSLCARSLLSLAQTVSIGLRSPLLGRSLTAISPCLRYLLSILKEPFIVKPHLEPLSPSVCLRGGSLESRYMCSPVFLSHYFCLYHAHANFSRDFCAEPAQRKKMRQKNIINRPKKQKIENALEIYPCATPGKTKKNWFLPKNREKNRPLRGAETFLSFKVFELGGSKP